MLKRLFILPIALTVTLLTISNQKIAQASDCSDYISQGTSLNWSQRSPSGFYTGTMEVGSTWDCESAVCFSGSFDDGTPIQGEYRNNNFEMTRTIKSNHVEGGLAIQEFRGTCTNDEVIRGTWSDRVGTGSGWSGPFKIRK